MAEEAEEMRRNAARRKDNQAMVDEFDNRMSEQSKPSEVLKVSASKASPSSQVKLKLSESSKATLKPSEVSKALLLKASEAAALLTKASSPKEIDTPVGPSESSELQPSGSFKILSSKASALKSKASSAS